MPKDKDGCISPKLTKKIKISDDTFIFRFSFSDENMVLGLPIGKHVVFSATINGELCERKYTPISQVTQKGYVDFVIKIYKAGVHPKFPEGGIMSQHVNNMAIGDIMLMEGPKGRLQYEGNGNFIIAKKAIEGKKNLGLVAGGTGITPCYQVIQASLKNNDGCKSSLVFGNRTTDDILLKTELMEFAENYKDAFNLYLTVDIQPEASENWQQGVGFITKEMLQKQLPAPGPDTLILYCGPPPFENMMKKHLAELGYDATMQFKF